MDAEDVRLAVYDGFRRRGRVPSIEELRATVGGDADGVRTALRELHEQRHVVLDADGEIVMAHPFTSVPLGFAVMGERTLWWGGCAWDAFAIPHLIPEEPSVLVATTCLGCGAALAWVVDRNEPPAGDEVAHFLTPMARVWDDVVHACANQRIFCAEQCVDAWLVRTGSDGGYVMDLATLWQLSSGWYAGRFDRGYCRREPVAAKEYFAGAGLRGPFWGLPD